MYVKTNVEKRSDRLRALLESEKKNQTQSAVQAQRARDSTGATVWGSPSNAMVILLQARERLTRRNKSKSSFTCLNRPAITHPLSKPISGRKHPVFQAHSPPQTIFQSHKRLYMRCGKNNKRLPHRKSADCSPFVWRGLRTSSYQRPPLTLRQQSHLLLPERPPVKSA